MPLFVFVLSLSCNNKGAHRKGQSSRSGKCLSRMRNAHRILLDETDEGRPLDLDGLPVAIVQRDHKVEEVRLAQIAGRLLLEVGASDAETVRLFHPVSIYIRTFRATPPSTSHNRGRKNPTRMVVMLSLVRISCAYNYWPSSCVDGSKCRARALRMCVPASACLSDAVMILILF